MTWWSAKPCRSYRSKCPSQRFPTDRTPLLQGQDYSNHCLSHTRPRPPACVLGECVGWRWSSLESPSVNAASFWCLSNPKPVDELVRASATYKLLVLLVWEGLRARGGFGTKLRTRPTITRQGHCLPVNTVIREGQNL